MLLGTRLILERIANLEPKTNTAVNLLPVLCCNHLLQNGERYISMLDGVPQFIWHYKLQAVFNEVHTCNCW